MARILPVSHIAPPSVDGGSRVIFKIGDYLKKHHHQILILTSNANSTDDFTHSYTPATNYGLPVYTIFHKPLKHISKVLAKGPLFKILPFLKFLANCYHFHPEYIIAGPLPTTTILYANLTKKITGAKLIINASFHYNDPEFHQPSLIKSLLSADLIWTLTKFETKYFHDHFAIPYSKMICLGNGIDQDLITNKFQLSSSNFKLLFIGSFSAHKGLETLFNALKLLPKKYHLTIAGQPTLSQLTIPSRVTVIKNFPQSKLISIIDQSTILVSPSTQESFGLVLLEAMARGRSIIAADIPASTELITNSRAGMTFRVNDPHDLANKITNLCTHPKLIKRFSQNGIRYAASYTWDKIGESLWSKISSL